MAVSEPDVAPAPTELLSGGEMSSEDGNVLTQMRNMKQSGPHPLQGAKS